MLYLITIIIAIIQLTIVNVISIGNIKPDLLLILVVFVALKRGPWVAAAIGILAGFMKDVFGLGVYMNTLAMPLYAILMGIVKEKFYFIKENFLTELLAVLAICVLDSVLMIFYFSNWDYPPAIFTLIIYIAIPAVLYTSVASVPVFSILKNYAS